MTSPPLVRRPFNGSCPCKKTKYIVYLTLPNPDSKATTNLKLSGPELQEQSGHRIYKCNCTVCHKIGYFHLRLPYAPKDFILLSPGPGTPFDNSDPILRSYDTKGGHKWQFCGNCGARCFTTNAKLEAVEVDLPVGLIGDGDGGQGDGGKEGLVKVKGQRISETGYHDEAGNRVKYFSVNAVTIDAYQDGASLVEWHDNGWLHYVDCLEDKGGSRFQQPHNFGMY